MLTLSLNNNIIPLPRNFSMRLTVKTPFFQFDRIPYSFSLDFSLPVNQYTSAIFAHPERVTKRRFGTDQKFSGFQVRFKGALLLSGSVTLSVSGDTFSCTAVDLIGELNDATKERSILDIPAFAAEIDFVNSSNYDPDQHPYCCFPIVNAGFFRDRGVKVKRTVYENVPGEGLVATDEKYETEVLSYCFSKSAASRINALNANGTVKQLASTIDLSRLHEKNNSYDTGQVSVVTPFFFLNHIISQAIRANNLHVASNYLADNPDLKNLVIYNNFDITSTAYQNELEDIYAEWSTVHTKDGTQLVEDYSSVGKRITNYIRSYSNKLTVKNHLPKMKVGETLLSTQNKFNLMFDFLPNRTVNILSREVLMSAEAINLQKYAVGKLLPGTKEYRAINFTREHDKLDLVFSERYIDINDRRGDVKDPVADWAALLALPNPAEGDIRLLTSLNKYCEYKRITQTIIDQATKEETTADVLGWEEISISMQNGWVNYGRENVMEIKTGWSTCYASIGQTFVNQQGDQANWKSAKSSFSPRLLIYAGNNAGGNEVAGLSLEYEKPGNGLIEKHWKRTARMLADALPITGYFDLPVNVLRSVIYNKCLPYRTNEASFFIDELSVDLYIDRIGTTEMKLYKRE